MIAWNKGRKLTDEEKIKIGDINRGKKMSDEQKLKISLTFKLKKINVGKIFSNEHKENLRKSHVGLLLSIETKKKQSEAKKMNCNTGQHSKKPVLQVKDNQIIAEFESIVKASLKTGICKVSIAKCCRHEQKKTGDYQWSFKN